MAVSYNRDQIRIALVETDPNFSNYLDLQTGDVIKIQDTDDSPEAEQLRGQIMESYGDRYRYIPGGNPSPEEADVQAWLDAEGL